MTAKTVEAISAAVQRIAKSPAMPEVSNAAASPVIADDIATAIVNSPEVRHITNQEPWYQSRVTLGSIVAIAATVYTLFTGKAFDQMKVLEMVMGGVPVLGGLFALYGRYFAKKPLGA